MVAETTGSINCPACNMSFDSTKELEQHSRQVHAISESDKESKPASMPSMEERVKSRTEEKGLGPASD